jgi:hypothetical protein
MECCTELLFRPTHYLTSLSGQKNPKRFYHGTFLPRSVSMHMVQQKFVMWIVKKWEYSASTGLQTEHVADMLAQKEPDTNE